MSSVIHHHIPLEDKHNMRSAVASLQTEFCFKIQIWYFSLCNGHAVCLQSCHLSMLLFLFKVLLGLVFTVCDYNGSWSHCDLYLEGAWLKSWLGHWLSWPRTFVACLKFIRQIQGYYIRLGRHCMFFLLYYYWNHPTIQHCIMCSTDCIFK